MGPYYLDWAGQQYKCSLSQWITFTLLASLQAVNLFWLFFILRILWRAIASFGEEARDDRSEYDTDEDEDRKAELEGEKKEFKEKLIGNGAAKH